MTGRIRGILRERKGIALASVMIIFIVSAILVTGISAAVIAQANIIRSREYASQAHYYAYSAAETIKKAMESSTDAIPTADGIPMSISLSGLIPSGEDASIVSATVTKLGEVDNVAYCLLSVTARDGNKESTVVASMSFDIVEEAGAVIDKQLLYNNISLNSDPYNNSSYFKVGNTMYRGKNSSDINAINSSHKINSLPILRTNVDINSYISTIPVFNQPSKYDISYDTSRSINFDNSFQWNNKNVKITSADNLSINNTKTPFVDGSILDFSNTKTLNFQNTLLKVINSTIYAPECDKVNFSNGMNFFNSLIYMNGNEQFNVSVGAVMKNSTLVTNANNVQFSNGTTDFDNTNIFMLGTDSFKVSMNSDMENCIIYTNARSVEFTNSVNFTNVKIIAPNAEKFIISSNTNTSNTLFYLPNVTNYNSNSFNYGTLTNNTRIYAPKASITWSNLSGMDGVFYFKSFHYSKDIKINGIMYVTDTFSVQDGASNGDVDLDGALLAGRIESSSWNSRFVVGAYDANLIKSYLYPNSEFSFSDSGAGSGGSGTKYELKSMTYTKAS